MIAGVLKLFFFILLLDYTCTNSISVAENKVDSFTGGYHYYANVGYYKLYSLETTWSNAWKQCRIDGGHLVVIDSEEEHEIVWDMLEQNDANAFIGVHDFFFVGSFFTITGHPFVPSSYNKWSQNEPSGYARYDCVVMGKDGELSVQDCNERRSFICEFEFK